ncbi:lipid asymmetry maintenance protein MlaB [Polynucleobacter brandtiae]|nr:STAS domain-containing protein [Polynucleobacter brandtiae]
MSFLLPASVTQANAVQLERDGLLSLTTSGLIDCSGLQDFDSTVLTVLISWQKNLQARGLNLQMTGAPEKLTVLASVYGVSALLGLS